MHVATQESLLPHPPDPGSPAGPSERIAELERLVARRTTERDAAQRELERQGQAAGQARAAEAGALSARLHAVVDELRRLSGELDERNTAVAAANWRLEQRVAERTAALQGALDAKRASELRFRAVAESLPQPVWTSGPGGRWDYASTRWAAYTGQAGSQSRGLGWLEAVHPDDRQQTMAAWHAAAQAGDRLMVEHRLRSAAGEWRWFETQALKVPDGDPAAALRDALWVGSSADIHARKLAEAALNAARAALEGELEGARQELAESTARFLAYFRILPDALFVVACMPDGRFLHEAVNAPFERLTGLWAERAEGRQAHEFMPAAIAAVFEEHYRRCAASHRPHAFDALLALPAGDRVVRVSLVSSPGAGIGGATRCLLGSARLLRPEELPRLPPDLDA